MIKVSERERHIFKVSGSREGIWQRIKKFGSVKMKTTKKVK